MSSMTSLTVSTMILRSKSAKATKLTFRNLHQFLKQNNAPSYSLSNKPFNFNTSVFRGSVLSPLNRSVLPQRIYVNGINGSLNYSTTTSTSSGDPEANSGEKYSEEEIEDAGEENMTLTLTDEELQKLTDGDPELVKKVRYIQLEHEILRQEGVQVPSKRISMGKWAELLRLETKGKRRKFHLYLFKIEKADENLLLKKEEKKKKRIEMLAGLPELPPLGEDPDGMIYGLNRNTLWMRLYDEKVCRFYHGRLIQEMMFGQPLVIDCGYTQHMNLREAKNCANQLELIFSANRVHDQPFDLHYCNVNRDDDMIKSLHKKIPVMFNPEFPFNMTEKSYLDIFPREKLVYLSPHAKEDLIEFDPEEIYIIGAMVDKSDPRPFSAAKAKKENLRIKRLPLDLFLDWGLGHKSLTLDQMINILLDARLFRDWKTAFKHVPKRKLRYFGNNDYDSNQTDDRQNFNSSRFTRGKIDPPQFFRRPNQNDDHYQSEEIRHNRNSNYGSLPRHDNRQMDYTNNDNGGYQRSNNYNRRNYEDNDRGFSRSYEDNNRDYSRNSGSNNYPQRHHSNADYRNERPRQSPRTNVRNLLDD